jgi:hypothetical protein
LIYFLLIKIIFLLIVIFLQFGNQRAGKVKNKSKFGSTSPPSRTRGGGEPPKQYQGNLIVVQGGNPKSKAPPMEKKAPLINRKIKI